MIAHTLSTMAVVIITPFFFWGLRSLCRQIEKLIPEGRFKRIMTADRSSAYQKPTLDSLRRGLK